MVNYAQIIATMVNDNRKLRVLELSERKKKETGKTFRINRTNRNDSEQRSSNKRNHTFLRSLTFSCSPRQRALLIPILRETTISLFRILSVTNLQCAKRVELFYRFRYHHVSSARTFLCVKYIHFISLRC